MKRSPLFGRLAALSDPVRARLIAALERHELTVGELHRALQLPQSTVSRHLRALAEAGWVARREEGTSNLYRFTASETDASARKLWLAVREELHGLAAVQRDAERVRGVLAGRHTTSQNSLRQVQDSGIACASNSSAIVPSSLRYWAWSIRPGPSPTSAAAPASFPKRLHRLPSA